jgi:hypothetical protein
LNSVEVLELRQVLEDGRPRRLRIRGRAGVDRGIPVAAVAIDASVGGAVGVPGNVAVGWLLPLVTGGITNRPRTRGSSHGGKCAELNSEASHRCYLQTI